MNQFSYRCIAHHRDLPFFPTRRSSDLLRWRGGGYPATRRWQGSATGVGALTVPAGRVARRARPAVGGCSRTPFAQVPQLRSEEHTSELQSPVHLVCRLLLEKKKCNGYL